MPIHQTLLCFILISALSLASAGDPSAYEMLERFGFPKGILPEGVQSYLHRPDGSFEVLLRGDCEFRVDGGYLLRYRRKITGRIADGSLTELSGASVKVLLVWFGINEVLMRGADLNFYVGPFSASFPASNFQECPQCRCGFECPSPAAASLLLDS